MQKNGLEGFDLRGLPTLGRRPLDPEHVIGEELAKA